MKKLLLQNVGQLATFKGNYAHHGKQMQEVTLLDGCSILVEDGKISKIFDTPNLDCTCPDVQKIDCKGNLVTAGYVDCHTHLVFAGNRAKEFEMRLAGRSYMEIMRAGGGIVNTVTATRNATEEELLALAVERAGVALSYGVTTMEAKSGYGLDKETELKQLQVLNRLNQLTSIEVVPTFMGAHATPKGEDTEQYVDFVAEEVLPLVAQQGIAEYCDCFCENHVFSVEQTKKIMQRAQRLGLKVKIHADEIESIGGVALGCEMGATSVDHLLQITQEDIEKLANSDTVGVILPATAFSLKEHFAPARKMIDAGCAVAVATDFNPGSCNTQSIPLIIALSNIYCQMSMAETLCALTINGACAVGRGEQVGTVEVGKQADLLIHNVSDLSGLCYHFCRDTVRTVIKAGEVVLQK